MSIVSAQVFNRFAANEGVVGEEQAMTSRPTSSANFYINSLDKPAGTSSGSFTINKNQNLFNGFFNRIAVNEIVVDWGIPNVAQWWGNTSFQVTFTATAPGGLTGTFYVILTDGFYTVEQALDEIVDGLNAAIVAGGGPASVFAVVFVGSTYVLEVDAGVSTSLFIIDPTPFNVGVAPNVITYTPAVLGRQLFPSSAFTPVPSPAALWTVSSPKLLGTTYIDIVSENLTYNQKVRDSTTNPTQRDVLYRWYFAYDNVPIPLDAYKFPILQAYDPFIARRTPPVVKQIRWSESQPIGQVAFQVYDDQGRLIDTSKFPNGAEFQFQMSCLLSEE